MSARAKKYPQAYKLSARVIIIRAGGGAKNILEKISQSRKHPIPYLNTCITYLNTLTPHPNTCITYP